MLHVVVILGASLSVFAPRPAVAGGPAPVPTLTLEATAAAPGDTIVARLEHWPAGTASVAICGNNTARGSADCDLISAQGVGISATGPTRFELTVGTPPVGCPCVVRAATPASDVVMTAPISLLGVAESGPVAAPATAAPAGDQLVVRVRLTGADTSWPASWFPAFAGPKAKALVVNLRNQSTAPFDDLRIVAAVGRDRGSGEPLAVRRIASLAPGASRTVRLAVDIAAPVWGDYHVFGDVYGRNVAVPFDTTTTNDPWALELLLPIALILIAQLLRRREAARKRRDAARTAAMVAVPLVVAMSFPQCSPDVGESDEGRCQSDSYDQLRCSQEPVVVLCDDADAAEAPEPVAQLTST